MLTREQVLQAVKGGRESECLDKRDYNRLCDFFPQTDWEVFGFKPTEGTSHQPKEWNSDEVIHQLRRDVAFGFEKALDKRGISASFMHSTVEMWLWILEDELLQSHGGGSHYPEYGLPLFKAVALKFSFPNPIGDDEGNEHKYSSEAEME